MVSEQGGGKLGGEQHGGGPHAGGPHAGGPHAGGPHAGGPHAGGPHAGGPHAGGPQRGEPHGGGQFVGRQHGGEQHGGGQHGGGQSLQFKKTFVVYVSSSYCDVHVREHDPRSKVPSFLAHFSLSSFSFCICLADLIRGDDEEVRIGSFGFPDSDISRLYQGL